MRIASDDDMVPIHIPLPRQVGHARITAFGPEVVLRQGMTVVVPGVLIAALAVARDELLGSVHILGDHIHRNGERRIRRQDVLQFGGDRVGRKGFGAVLK